MLRSQEVEQLISAVSAMDRHALIDQFHTYRASFPLDFTPQFLTSASLDQLRHIFVAVCLQSQHLPVQLAA
jgi:hypothetical protein